MTLLALYAGCLVLGGILIGASMLGGGKDFEADTDHDVSAGDDAALDHEVEADGGTAHEHHLSHDHAHDHQLPQDHAHAQDPEHSSTLGGLAATLLSLRFWTFALASFGMTGLLLTLLGANPLLGILLSGVTGATVGGGVTTLLRAVSRDTVTSALDSRTLRGRDAEVVLSVGPSKLGKIRLVHNGQTIELPATTREGRLLERAERVLVVDIKGGTADVTSLAPDRRPPSPIATHS